MYNVSERLRKHIEGDGYLDRDKLQRRIAIRLKSVCHKQKISQSKLSEMSGISRETLNRCFNGNRMPDVFTLACIANALNISTDYLIFGQ